MSRASARLAAELGDLCPDGWRVLTDADHDLRIEEAIAFVHPDGGGVFVCPWSVADPLTIERPKAGPVFDRCGYELPRGRAERREAVARALAEAAAWFAEGVLPSPSMSPRGGARPGAGRKPRAGTAATARPGPRMTDAEYAPVLAMAAVLDANGKPLGEVGAMRALIDAGARRVGLDVAREPGAEVMLVRSDEAMLLDRYRRLPEVERFGVLERLLRETEADRA